VGFAFMSWGKFFRASLLVNAKQNHAIWVRFLVLGRKDTFQKMGQIINAVTGSHRFKHGAIGAGQLDQLYGMGFGAAGASDGGGSNGFHILAYTESQL
jgi:hypothetical protein